MKWYGSVTNRVMEASKPNKPEAGQFATISYYSDRTPVLITKVEDDGKTFFTVDVGRVTKSNSNIEAIITEDGGNKYATFILNDDTGKIILYENVLLLESDEETEFWIFIDPEYLKKPETHLKCWKLCKDGRYHKARFSEKTKRYHASQNNTMIIPNYYSYYYDMSF